jgi:regulator of replication initiation timing
MTLNVHSSPEVFEAAFRAHHSKVTEQAPAAAVMEYMAKLSQQGLPRAEIAEAAIDFRTRLEKGYKDGRDSWGGDFDDTARDVLRAAAIASEAAKGVALGVAVKNPALAAGAAWVSGVTDVAKGIAENALNMTPVQDMVKESRNLFSAHAMHDLVDKYNRSGSDMIKQFYDQCLQDEECQGAAAVVFPDLTSQNPDKVDLLPGAIVDANRDVFDSLQITVNTDLSVNIDLDGLKQSLIEEFRTTATGLHDDLSQVTTELQTLREEQRNLTEWLQDQAAQEAARKREEQLRAEIQQRWDMAQKGVEVVAVLAGVVDPKLGSDIRRIGGAGLTVVKAGMELVKAASTLSKGLSVATAMGSAAATGNFIGAAFALVSAFAPAGPTPEQMILDEIGALRDDMRTLHAESMERFDRLDRTLNVIYTDVMSKLDQIDVSLGKVNGKVDEVLTDLDRLEATLMRHQMMLVDFFQAAHREPLQIAFLTALGRTKVAEHPVMSPENYVMYEGLFRSWAAVISGNDVEVPTSAWDTSDLNLSAQLQGSALEHVALLGHVVTRRGWGSFTPLNARLHNAFTWMLAAAAYSELEREWPALAAAATSKEPHVYRDAVAAPGRQLLAALEQIPKRSYGDPLKGALDNLRNRYTAYAQALNVAESDWAKSGDLADLLGLTDAQRRGPRPAIWRQDHRLEQGLAPSVFVWREGALTPEPGLELPPAAVARIPALFRFASYLASPGDGHLLRVVVSTTTHRWTEEIEIEVPGDGPWAMDEYGVYQPPPSTTRIEQIHHWSIDYDAGVFYRGQEVQRYSLTDQRHGDLAHVWNSFWSGLISRASGLTDQDLDEALAVTDIETARGRIWHDGCYPWLKRRQTEGEISDPLRAASLELNGALRLLDCLLELGLPTARTRDEGMHATLSGTPVWQGGVGLCTPDEFLSYLAPGQATAAPAPQERSLQDELWNVTEEPLNLLQERIVTYQTALEAGTYAEFYRDIELTLQRLATAAALVDYARNSEEPVVNDDRDMIGDELGVVGDELGVVEDAQDIASNQEVSVRRLHHGDGATLNKRAAPTARIRSRRRVAP